MSTSTCVIMGPGLLISVGQALREPVGNVQFVGTETSDMWRGYMEGAVRSGIGGAEEVIEALQGQKKRSVASL
ncbi:twin-arginine translocation pathway signal [Phyllosticta citricarpa]